MISNRRNVTIVLCGLALSTGLAIAGAKAQSNPPQSPAAPKLAEEEFKNIQALKGAPADLVRPSMQFITASLGVECEYCHVRGDHGMEFDKDDKKTKVTARKMMKMMFAINKDNFEGHREVTCYSCHRGAAEPVGIPIITDEEPKVEAERGKAPGEAKSVFPPADQLLDKYLAAVGGEAASAEGHQPRRKRRDHRERPSASHRGLCKSSRQAALDHAPSQRREHHGVRRKTGLAE